MLLSVAEGGFGRYRCNLGIILYLLNLSWFLKVDLLTVQGLGVFCLYLLLEVILICIFCNQVVTFFPLPLNFSLPVEL